ncbi:hypothetical protein L4C34_20115 [Vibrio profundum]
MQESVAFVLNSDESIPKNRISVLSVLWKQYRQKKEDLKVLEQEKNPLTRQMEPCNRLMKLEGVGETIAAMHYSTLEDGQ